MIKKTTPIAVLILAFSTLMPAAGFQSAMTPELSNPGGEHSRLFRLHYASSSGEKGVSTFVYDTDSRLVRSVWSLLDNSRNSLNTYTRDASGRIVGKHRVFSDGKTSDQSYTYNTDGFLAEEFFKRSDGVSGSAKYFRDDKGRIHHADCRGLNGWFAGRIDFSHHPDGRVSGARLTRKGNPLGRITFVRDQRGRLTKETWHIGSWSQTFSYEYRNHPCRSHTASSAFLEENCNFRLVREEYDFNGKTGGPSLYGYDKAGRLVSKKFIRSDGLTTTTTYIYTPDGILRKSLRRYSDGKTGEFSYRFNEKRRLLERRFKRSDGVTGRETYTWNDQGRLLTARWDQFDSWLTGDLTFSHDPYGRLESGTFTGEKGLDARIRFTHDDNGNLIRIHWEFSSGHTQTYSFSYEPL